MYYVIQNKFIFLKFYFILTNFHFFSFGFFKGLLTIWSLGRDLLDHPLLDVLVPDYVFSLSSSSSSHLENLKLFSSTNFPQLATPKPSYFLRD